MKNAHASPGTLLSYNVAGLLTPAQSDRLIVVLVSTRNPLNIGAAARAMSNFGFLHLRVVNPYEPSFREARSAVGAAEVLAGAEQYTSVADALSDCSLVVGSSAIQNRTPQLRLEGLESAAILIRQHLEHGRVAVLFGSEKRGLSNDDLSHCHWVMHVPTRQEHRSMNLGQAVAVCLYELARGPEGHTSPAAPEGASAGELEKVTELLIDALRISGYLAGAAEAAGEAKVRRFVRRLAMSGEDAELFLGMLRQIIWKLKG
jgi:TrmH family RNA methyltransferase